VGAAASRQQAAIESDGAASRISTALWTYLFFACLSVDRGAVRNANDSQRQRCQDTACGCRAVGGFGKRCCALRQTTCASPGRGAGLRQVLAAGRS